MRPLILLKCIAKVVAKGVGNAVGLGGAIDIADDVMKAWNREADDAARKAELEEVARLAAGEFRRQVEVVVREIAGDQPASVRDRVTAYLQEVPGRVRERLRRPDDLAGTTLPPGFRLDTPADLAPLLPPIPAEPPATEDGAASLAPVTADDVPRVTLRYTAGPNAGGDVVYTEPTVLLFGRTSDCDPQLPQEPCRRVSRRHCLLEVNPPDVRVRDLGSKHGTFIDGNLIGKRPEGEEPNDKFKSPEHALGDGAEVRLTDEGKVAFTVHISVSVQQAVRECAWCRKEVDEPGANRPGEFVCAACRGEAGTVVRNAVAAAQHGDPDLRAIQEYELLNELGHGGMGAVHLARHKWTGAAVAVKVLLPRVAASEHAVSMFRREIRNTAALNHRNVVRCLDHGFSKGAFFLVLEYCDGGSVEKLVAKRGGKLPVDEAVEIALQSLDGLEYAHHAPIPYVRKKNDTYGPGEGMVHRDIKPANLFLSGWGSGRVVRVGDYGLAKAFEESGLSGGTRTGDYAGTPKFMCRKQVIGYKRAGPEADVWSLAASLYTMLTGRGPRDFPDGMDPWLAILENPAVPILQRNPALPVPLAKVIDDALEEPAMPFKTAAEFKRALEVVA